MKKEIMCKNDPHYFASLLDRSTYLDCYCLHQVKILQQRCKNTTELSLYKNTSDQFKMCYFSWLKKERLWLTKLYCSHLFFLNFFRYTKMAKICRMLNNVYINLHTVNQCNKYKHQKSFTHYFCQILWTSSFFHKK